MADVATTLTEAYAALQAIGPPVRFAGDDDPETSELIVLADLSDTGVSTYGLQTTRTLIQVSCYAKTKLRALSLDAKARTELRGLGFYFSQSRGFFDADAYGQISDFRR